MRILILILLLSAFASCHGIEDGWKEIRPLKTDKITVNKLLGNPEIDDLGYHNYETEEAFIQVTFSADPCSNDNLGRGKYKITKDVVLKYDVIIKKELKLSDFSFAREKYRKVIDSELIGIVHYYNNEDGIEIVTSQTKGIEYVAQIHFKPGAKDIEKFKCSNVDLPSKTQ